jgi:hypothetical protein
MKVMDHRPQVAVKDVLRVIDEFGEASIGLIAWELITDAAAVHRAWEDALERGLIVLTTVDRVQKEWLARLTAKGLDRITQSEADGEDVTA